MPPHPKRGRRCTICDDPQQDAIEEALKAGTSLRGVARQFGKKEVWHANLWRHTHRCMGADLVLAQAVTRLKRAGLVVPEGLDKADALSYVRRVVVAMAGTLESRVVELIEDESWTTSDLKGAEKIKSEIAEFREWVVVLRDTELKVLDQKLQARVVELDERREVLLERMVFAALDASGVSGDARVAALEAAARVAESQ